MATGAKGSRAASFLTAVVVLVVCSCRGALGFVAPTVLGGGELTAGKRQAYGATNAVSAARPRAALLRLYSSKPPTTGGTDFMDSIAGEPREMSNEERIVALQREIAAQVSLADETEASKAVEEKEEEKAEDVVELDEDNMTDEEIEKIGFTPPEGFVDEGKVILWPTTRRVVQLTLLATAAQIAFIVYIIGLNSFLNSFPAWFGQFVDIIKSGK